MSNAATYVGQVERDPEGTLWAILYFHDQVIERQRVRSLRQGKRRVSDMVLAAADNFPQGPTRSTQVALNRLVDDHRAANPRRRRIPSVA